MTPKFHRGTARPAQSRVKKFLESCGLSIIEYKDWMGGSKSQPLLEFWKLNPTWTLRRWEKLVWENRSIITGRP